VSRKLVGQSRVVADSSTRKHRTEIRLRQNAGDFLAFVPLYLDLTVFHCATGAACALHGFGKLLFFWKTDADKILHYGHSFAAASRCLADDVHATTILFGLGGG